MKTLCIPAALILCACAGQPMLAFDGAHINQNRLEFAFKMPKLCLWAMCAQAKLAPSSKGVSYRTDFTLAEGF